MIHITVHVMYMYCNNSVNYIATYVYSYVTTYNGSYIISRLCPIASVQLCTNACITSF